MTGALVFLPEPDEVSDARLADSQTRAAGIF
jgi:hypothetical protein